MGGSPSAPVVETRGSIGAIVLPVLLITVSAIAAHATSANATFLWDDDVNLTGNTHLRDVAGLSRLWFDVGATNMYAPLTFTTLWAQFQLWALHPAGYHIVNIAFHALNSVLVWLLLRRLLPAGALLAGAVFAVHPITVESVAWITELRNVQSAALYLLCLLAYVRFAALDGEPPLVGRHRAIGYASVLLLFASALLSKPSGIALPLVIVLIAWWKRGRVAREDLAIAAPMLAMSLAAGLLTMYVDEHFAGRGSAWQMSLAERGLVSARVVWFYVGKLLWPHPLVSIYPRWDVQATAWWQYAFPVSLAGVLAALWANRARIGRGPLVAVCSFILLVAPTSGLFNFSYHLYSFVADRYQYHASIALIALASTGLAGCVRRRSPASWPVRLAASVIVILLAATSAIHAGAYRSEKARCLATIERNRSAWVAMNNLGVALNAEGRHQEAVEWYGKALSLRPTYPEAHSNRGAALVALGRTAEAIDDYREALRVWPDYAQAHNNMGTALAGAGDIRGAVEHYEAALSARPGYPEAHNNLGQLLTRLGHVDRAIEHHRAALLARPDYAEAHHDLAVTLGAAGRYDEAVAEYRIALSLRPDNAASRSGLASALAALGRTAEAENISATLPRNDIEAARAQAERGLALASAGRVDESALAFAEALRLDPAQADAHNGLGNVLAARGQLADAIAHYRAAVRAKPDFVEARANLGTALASQGNAAEAIEELREAIRRDDRLADAHNMLGICLARTGRLEEAIAHFRRSVALDGNASARENLERALALRREPARE